MYIMYMYAIDDRSLYSITVYNTIKNFFHKVIYSTSVAGRKDYYIWILVCDVLCFITIVFGYSSFSVSVV